MKRMSRDGRRAFGGCLVIAVVTLLVVVGGLVAFAWPVLTYYSGKEGRCAELYIGAMDTDDCHGRDLREDGQLTNTGEHCRALIYADVRRKDARCRKARAVRKKSQNF